MDPELISNFVAPILDKEADYTKGNRFYELESLEQMPKVRLFGNAVLSFLSKLSSGYWNVFDPTNGYTAVHTSVLRRLPLEKLSKRYFFESDMLFRLNTVRAVVLDIPMKAKYDEEESGLRPSAIVFEFLAKHGKNLIKRLFYNYYLRDMSIASIELPLGILFLVFGSVIGGTAWMANAASGIPTPTGTVVLSALQIIVGIQLVLAFLSVDISSVPNRPLVKLLKKVVV